MTGRLRFFGKPRRIRKWPRTARQEAESEPSAAQLEIRRTIVQKPGARQSRSASWPMELCYLLDENLRGELWRAVGVEPFLNSGYHLAIMRYKDKEVQVLAIVAKSAAQAWLEQSGKSDENGPSVGSEG
jgi:hypothetical protein